ncbi:valine-tRNA ligase [Acanthamoeba castellanii str. Neff]|uniref:valine--tRNA ligase n=1 Tax=Acanthamoeba castellanii (strain ATCC 30010 / Neff) TaxID=1257118 RepID=L8HC27_ACACF|nr:valine-tRNA ligase [Acanthamoeba castellanii str. Neff]ELR21946.1 valine-tRNA ligase [Acanthamoeba castellanii str. Neff]
MLQSLRRKKAGGGLASIHASGALIPRLEIRSSAVLFRSTFGPLAAAYDPKAIEGAGWYQWYESQGYFRGKNGVPPGHNFSMVIPPPNVTGTLHIGHTLTVAIQDSIVRWRRMMGDNVLYVPGTDHAGIATQTVVERRLQKEKKLTRHDLGREAFIDEVWKWKETHGNHINNQLRRLGTSLDWSREVFTMDPQRSKAVTEAFVRLHDEGLVYRSTRLVNWCCFLQTVISDIEVEYESLSRRTMIALPGKGTKKYEFGVIHHFLYRVEGGGELEVATTRPETILGDSALAVHPEDPRYVDFIGRRAIHPFTGQPIPIVADPILVDRELGTGVVKITPGHDFDDFACGVRHNLPRINLLRNDGTLNQHGLHFQGLDRMEARRKVVEELEKMGLYKDKKDHESRIALCSRSGDVLEPLLKPQWYVACQDMGADAARMVRDGTIELIPDFHKHEWYRWMENVEDWCVSRQLWWGHRVPAYKVVAEGEERAAANNKDNDTLPEDWQKERWVIARNQEEALEKAKALYPDIAAPKLEQDEDVLDTWFSSSLFPISALGWPDNTQDLKEFYPLSVMETGADILFFWVARMAMICSKLSPTQQAPFKKVYLHGMVRDAHGRKMSKSLGNVIDPLHVIEGIPLEQLLQNLNHNLLDEAERKKATAGIKSDYPAGIPQCGTDALRFTLVNYTQQTRNINLDINKVVANRHFCNKMWNATRFVLSYAESTPVAQPEPDDLASKWILSRLSQVVTKCNQGMSDSEFHVATSSLYDFFLNEFCDVYLEYAKLYISGEAQIKNVLNTCLESYFRLLHPFMPYVSEELWQRLPTSQEKEDCLMHAAYPLAANQVAAWRNEETYEKPMEEVLRVLHAVRSLRDGHGATPLKYSVSIHTTDASLYDLLSNEASVIRHLARASRIDVQHNAAEPEGCGVRVLDSRTQIFLPLLHLGGGDHQQTTATSAEVSLSPENVANLQKEVEKMNKRKKKLEKEIEWIEQKVAGPYYLDKVPLDVRNQDKEAKAEAEKQLKDVERSIRSVSDFMHKYQPL